MSVSSHPTPDPERRLWEIHGDIAAKIVVGARIAARKLRLFAGVCVPARLFRH